VKLWGSRYFAIRIYGAPLVLVGFVLTGYFRGIADAVSPMWMTIVATVVNVVGDYGLIYGKLGLPEMGVVGAAWASVVAALCSLLYGLLVLITRHRAHLTKLSAGLVDRTNLRRLLATNASLFGRTACLLFAQFYMLSTVARMGEVPLAANAVAWQVWSLVSYFVDGLAHAAETLVGNALGARRFSAARQVACRCLWWGGGLGLAFGCTYLAAMGPIARSFTDHAPVITAVLSLTLWIAIIQPLNAMVFIWDGVFIGANDTLYLFGAMALAAFALFLPAMVVFVHFFGLGLQGVWMGYNGLMVGRFLTLGLRFRGNAWMRTFAVEQGGRDVQA
jgi:putative MATE family efflux protein